jgi:glycosyltransferase involved in cell wall biosynthesis
MNLIIYNPFSFGGNFDYMSALTKAYSEHEEVKQVSVIMPANASKQKGQLRLLLPDRARSNNKVIKKLYFLYRSFVNPFRFYRYLRSQATGIVIFNDYDQLSSFSWVPFFQRLKNKFVFCVILHDPDRDRYLPSKTFSIYSMKRVMSLMDIAFYHGTLPIRPYYIGPAAKIQIPHGIYETVEVDKLFESSILNLKASDNLLSILGNIREEKNYELAIRSLVDLPDFKLLIAGAKANSATPVEKYRELISSLGLDNRVIFIEKFLTQPELHAAIKVSDIILLYYSATFTSQSGILNLIAPYKKKILVSDIESALTQDVKRYFIGEVVRADDLASFTAGVKLLAAKRQDESSWENYAKTASWSTNAAISINTFKKIRNN